ncbi:Uncharacterised protein [Legionella busanensis]|uniref:Uncharacterized protein n=1 Tax=Legionella busanensis TaxID=190655 RepID=A0A378KDT6_9GAMM|nr:hypothetical protein [Legionella busanensis]STX81691.1 Uncharacterised protein [Legionella busanensis]
MNVIQFLNSKWVFIILVLIAICLIYAFTSINETNTLNQATFYSSIGYALGYSTMAVIFFWAIPFWILGWLASLLTKKFRVGWATSKNGIMVGYILVLVFLLISTMETKRKTNQDIDYLSSIAKGTAVMEDKKQPENHSSTDSQNLINKIATSYKKVYQRNYNSIQKMNDDYQSLESRLEKSFIPDKLITITQINNARLVLSDFRKYINERNSINASFQSQIENELKNSGINNESFWKEYDSGKAKSEEQSKELNEINMELIETLSSLLDLIQNNLGHFSVANNVFTFDDYVAQSEYEQLSKKLSELAEKEQAITKNIENRRGEIEKFFQDLK